MIILKYCSCCTLSLIERTLNNDACASCLEQAPDFYKYLALSTEIFGISGPSLLFLMISLCFRKKDYLLKKD